MEAVVDLVAGWHDADTIFPEEGQLVLLWNGKTYGLGSFDLDDGWSVSPDALGEPTHWAYLPAPPSP